MSIELHENAPGCAKMFAVCIIIFILVGICIDVMHIRLELEAWRQERIEDRRPIRGFQDAREKKEDSPR